MRIFHITTNTHALSGGARQLIELGLKQSDNGHRVFYAFRKTQNKYTYTINESCKTVCLFFSKNKFKKFLEQCIDSIRPDIIHLHSEAYKLLIGHHNRNIKYPPIVINIGHSSGFSRDEIALFKKDIIKTIICVSESIRSFIIKEMGDAYKNKIYCVYSATDLDKFKPQKPSDSVLSEYYLNNKIVIGAVGKFYPYKGFDCLIDAISLFKNTDYSNEIILLLVGPEIYEYTKQIYELIENDDYLQSTVKIIGGKADVQKYISTFSFLVSPSISYEGVSGVVREAMAMKIPVICTTVGGNNEIAIDNITARTVFPKDSFKLFKAMEWMINNLQSALISEMKIKAYNLVKDNFSLQLKYRKVENIYISAIRCKNTINHFPEEMMTYG